MGVHAAQHTMYIPYQTKLPSSPVPCPPPKNVDFVFAFEEVWFVFLVITQKGSNDTSL